MVSVPDGLECAECERFIDEKADHVRQVVFQEARDELEAEAEAGGAGFPRDFVYRCPDCRGAA